MMQEVRRRTCPEGHSASTACKHTVSGSISFPSRGSFHLSLTVLVHYRSPRVFSLGAWSPQFPTRFHVSRGTQDHDREPSPFAYGTFTPCGGSFQRPSARVTVCNSRKGLETFPSHVLQPPDDIRLEPTKSSGFGLIPFRSPLLRESLLISFPRGT